MTKLAEELAEIHRNYDVYVLYFYAFGKEEAVKYRDEAQKKGLIMAVAPALYAAWDILKDVPYEYIKDRVKAVSEDEPKAEGETS
jgi:hypothetical protein